MERYYYIPISSLSLNNVLSSESISPPVFYEKRGYGFKRFEKVNANPFNNSVLAYCSIPILVTPKSDREEYPLYIAIPQSYIEGAKEKKEKGVSIKQIDGSVYLNWMECFFIARNSDEQKKVKAATNRSLEVKHAKLYLDNMITMTSKSFEDFSWDESYIDNINDFKNYNKEKLLTDQRLNKVKGFVYGYICGKLKEQPNEMTAGKRYFQEFINSFSGLMNELSVGANSYKNKTVKIDEKQVSKTLLHLQDLRERIDILLSWNETDEVNSAIKKSFGIDDATLESLQTIKYQNSKNTVYKLVEQFTKQHQVELYTINELLGEILTKAKRFSRFGTPESYQKLTDDFNNARQIINARLSEYQNQNISDNLIDSIPFGVSTDFSQVNLQFNDLKKEENKYWEMVINELLSRVELSTSDGIAQQRKDIIIGIAESIIKSSKEKDSSEIKYLRKLHKSIKTVGIGFKISETTNSPLKSLACFLSRYAEMEKLQDFMEKNGFSNYSMAYGNWGAAYGFANLSKMLLEPLYSNSDSLVLVSNFVAELVHDEKLDSNTLTNYLNSIESKEEVPRTVEWGIKNTVEEPNESYAIDNSFLQSIEGNKKLNKNKKWVTAIHDCSNQILNNKKREGLFNSFEWKVNEFTDLLKKKSKSLDKFGKAKIDEAILLFKLYIENE